MYCSNCGGEVSGKEKFCPYCGSRIQSSGENSGGYSENRQQSYDYNNYDNYGYDGTHSANQDRWEPPRMSFLEAVKTCFMKYVVFDGRARRTEYWYFFLFNFIIGMILGVIGTPVLSTIYSIAVFLPELAAEVRRLHDIGKSGLLVLVAFIPIVGVILLIVWACMDSEPGSNQYGENPKGVL